MTNQQATKQPQITDGFLSLEQIIGNKKHTPILPISKTTLYALIKRGAIPKPVKILSRCYYHIDTVKNIVASIQQGGAAA